MYRTDEVNGPGIFLGVCIDHRVGARMNVCCVRVLGGRLGTLTSQRQNSSE